MSVKVTEQNGHRGQFLSGNPGGPGRPKGSNNLFTMNLKNSIEEAFIQLGGVAWLVQLGKEDPKAFAALLARLLPKQIDADVVMTSTVEVVQNAATLEEIKAELAATDW